MYLQVQQTGFGAEHGGSFGFGNEGEAVVILVAEEAGLDSSGSCCSLASIVPDSRHSEEVSNVALLSVENLTQTLLQLVTHCLSQLEEVVGGNVDFRFSGRKRREVDRVDVGVSGKHQLQLEPFHLLNTGLRVACRRQCIGNVRAPTDDLLVLIVVENCWNLL